jgi:predicted alpha-1,2-mannosidase
MCFKKIKTYLFILSNIFCFTVFAQKNYTKLVNPFIGTGGHGHTYPGATSPCGMVQLSPDTRMADWDGSSGYHYSDSIIYGFSHTHLSGTGVPDYCDILFQPSVGAYEWQKTNYASTFNHASEKAYAGYYGVHLNKHNINVGLTTTARTGVHRYSFPENTKEGNVLIDLIHRDEVLDAQINILNDSTITGYRFSKSWAKNQKIFFAAVFNKKIIKHYLKNDAAIYPKSLTETGKYIQAYVSFNVADDKTLISQVAISGVSIDGALKNLIAENVHHNFDVALAQNEKNWNTALSQIEITSPSFKNIDTIFYSALYHTLIVPNLYDDVDGAYRGTDDKIHFNKNNEPNKNFTVFSLWDTYRAYHPLMSILKPTLTNNWINTFLQQYKQGGMLPVWELSANETFCMIGYHSVPVIVDAYKKGIRDFDTKLALEAMISYSNSKKFGIDIYSRKGFLSNKEEAESVSKTLEYAYDDWCIAEFAKLIGNKEVANEYYKRSNYFINLFNPATNFFQGKLDNMWVSQFNPTEINNFYTEGNAWHYRFAVPQNFEKLTQLMGGKNNFEKNLLELFNTNATLSGRAQADVTGLIGQYAHGNEPSHHLSYLFAKENLSQNKTPFFVNKICTEFYKNTPDGLIGNEDCGQMSAWYIWSALGFYPVNPASNEFIIGSPQVEKATIHVENKKDIIIYANKKNENEFFPLYKSNSIKFDDIKNGAIINLKMVTETEGLAKQKVELKKVFKTEKNIYAVPYIANETNKFKESTQVNIASINKNDTLYYALTNTERLRNPKFLLYKQPFTISENSFVHFYSVTNKNNILTQQFYKIKNDRTIQILTKLNPMYSAGGAYALIDGIKGTSNWRAGDWQSYYGNDMEVIIDLKQPKKINAIEACFLQDIGSWIWLPKNMIVYSSNDGINFTQIATLQNTTSEKDEAVKVYDWKLSVPNTICQYIKIIATNYGVIKNWHLGYGNNAHLFVSELNIDTE